MKRASPFLFIGIALTGVFAWFYFAAAGPTCAPPNCPGAIAADASRNVTIGSSTVVNARLGVVGSSTNSSFYAFKVGNSNGESGPILWARNDGKVSIATSSFSATSTLRVAGIVESVSGGFVFPDGTVQTTAGGGATSQAQNVSNVGAFGANTGGGNYSFPASLGIGTASPSSTLHMYGAAGTAAPVIGGGALYAQDSGGSPSNGGSLLFGASQGYWAGIKGLLTDGSSNSKGDLAFYTRNASADAALTERMRITASGTVIFGSGSGKIDVGTVDPVYTIGGERYATYLPAMTGQKEETSGVVNVKCQMAPARTTEVIRSGGNIKCAYTIDFNAAEKGSDLWLFAKVTDIKKHFGDLAVLLTPGFEGKVWYEKDAVRQTLTLFGSGAGEVSYRLTAPRFDAAEWPNALSGNDGISGFTIPEE